MDSNRIEIVEMARYLANGEHFFLEYNDKGKKFVV